MWLSRDWAGLGAGFEHIKREGLRIDQGGKCQFVDHVRIPSPPLTICPIISSHHPHVLSPSALPLTKCTCVLNVCCNLQVNSKGDGDEAKKSGILESIKSKLDPKQLEDHSIDQYCKHLNAAYHMSEAEMNLSIGMRCDKLD